jgi:hypothetical protein
MVPQFFACRAPLNTGAASSEEKTAMPRAMKLIENSR